MDFPASNTVDTTVQVSLILVQTERFISEKPLERSRIFVQFVMMRIAQPVESVIPDGQHMVELRLQMHTLTELEEYL